MVLYLLYILSITYIFLLSCDCIGFKDTSTLREKFLTLFFSQILSPQPSVCVISPHKQHNTQRVKAESP